MQKKDIKKNSTKLRRLPKPRKPTTNLGTIVASGSVEEWASQASIQDVYSLVKTNGVEECAEIIRFLPADTLRSVIDLDVWKNISSMAKGKKVRTGRREVFDAAQFLAWLQALLAFGVDEAVAALADLGTEFCAGAFSHFLRATAMDVYSMNKAESGLATEDKNVEHGNPLELGVFAGSYILLKPGLCLEDVAEVFQEILAGFEQYAPEVLEGIFYHIARQVDEQVAFEDFKTDRDFRLAGQGYVTAAKASEFLMRFRTEWGISRFSHASDQSNWDQAEFASFLETIIPSTHRPENFAKKSIAKLAGETGKQALFALMEWSATLPTEKKQGFQTQWLFLANLFATGWEHQGSKLSPKKALNFLESVVAFSLDGLIRANESGNPQQPMRNICDLFEWGWHSLLESVSLRAAKKLDERLRARDMRNTELREVWFRFCQTRKFKEFSVARWIFEGRYGLVADLLSELEFALPSPSVLRLRLLFDPCPSLPDHDSGNSPQATLLRQKIHHFHDHFRPGKKIAQKSKWIWSQAEIEPAFKALEQELQL